MNKKFEKSGEIDPTKVKRGHRRHDSGAGPHKSKRRERRQKVKEEIRRNHLEGEKIPVIIERS